MNRRIIIMTVAILLMALLGMQSVAFAKEADALYAGGAAVPYQAEDKAVASVEAKKTNAVTQAVAPQNISGLKITNSSYNSIKLTWRKSANAYKYLIYRSTSKFGGYKLIQRQKGTSYTDTRLKPSTKYYYKVVPYTINNVKGRASAPVYKATKSKWLDGAWVLNAPGDYKHMFVFSGAKVSFYRVDGYRGNNWIGRIWGTYPIAKNMDGTFTIWFNDGSARATYVSGNRISIAFDGEKAESYYRLDDSALAQLLKTI